MLNSPSVFNATVSGRHEAFVISKDSEIKENNLINFEKL